MLARLTIENLAIAENAELELAEGLNALTGETGAGKSIVVGALELALGGRASASAVRKGERLSVVEAVFDPPLPRAAADLIRSGLELEWNKDEPLTMRRELSIKGRSRCFIAGQLVNVGDLKRLGELLVDLHGQHEHQSLFHRSAQRAALDAFGDYEELSTAYRESHAEFTRLTRRRSELAEQARNFEQRLDYLDFQIGELDEVNAVAGELAQLAAEEARLANAESLAEAARRAYELLYEGRGGDGASAIGLLGEAARALQEIAALDPAMTEAPARAAEAEALIEDLGLTLRDYAARCEADPDRLEQVVVRVEALRRLLRKHGAADERELAKIRERLGAERDTMALDERERTEIEGKLASAEKRMAARAKKLFEARLATAKRFSAAISRTLARVAMQMARFEVRVERCESFTAEGGDVVEFLLAANPGEGSKPLREVASGGELSRTMLAIKTALARRDSIRILVFDEIDAGISGEAAARVGQLMSELAASHQVICVTHHASIAARAPHHLSIRKSTTGRRTRMEALKLAKEARLEELARMMGGDGTSPAGKRLARQLLGMS